MMPAVSVLMPAYNAEKYLPEAVESVLAQTFTDFEFIIVDDGSTDGSLAILRGYASQDARIRLISRPNTGYVVALNEMLGLARGEFIARMDADDVSLPERFEHQTRFLSENPDVAGVGGFTILMDGCGRRLTTVCPPIDDETIQSQMLEGVTTLSHPAVMFRREAMLAVGGYRVEAEFAEDIDLFLRLGDVNKLANLAEPVLKYRILESSVSQQRREIFVKNFEYAINEARGRRGMDRKDVTIAEIRPDKSLQSRHRFSLMYGWWAFGSGERRTAIHYGWQAVRLAPLRLGGWRLLACAVAKPSNDQGNKYDGQ